ARSLSALDSAPVDGAGLAISTQGVVRHRSRLFLLTAILFIVGLMASAPAADASKSVVRTIGSPNTSRVGAQFSTPRYIAINKTGNGGVPAGTFYVVDAFNNRIQRFSPSGQFVSTWGWGVRNGASEYQVCTDGPNCLLALAGNGAGEM